MITDIRIPIIAMTITTTTASTKTRLLAVIVTLP